MSFILLSFPFNLFASSVLSVNIANSSGLSLYNFDILSYILLNFLSVPNTAFTGLAKIFTGKLNILPAVESKIPTVSCPLTLNKGAFAI